MGSQRHTTALIELLEGATVTHLPTPSSTVQNTADLKSKNKRVRQLKQTNSSMHNRAAKKFRAAILRHQGRRNVVDVKNKQRLLGHKDRF